MGNSGHRGPTPEQTYSDPPWPSSSYFSIKNGKQNWTVPANGTYQITAAGAYGATPGRVVTGQVTLREGQVLTMLVGQQPTPLTANVADNVTVGGGGGTFVVTNGTPLIVASGGDGSGPTSSPGSFTYRPLPYAVTSFVPSNPTTTTVDLNWNAPLYASSYSIVSSPPTFTQTTSGTSMTFLGPLTPDTEYTFTITPSNASGNGPQTTSDPISTLLPYPGRGPAPNFPPTAATPTTITFSWVDYIPQYADSYKVYCRDPNTYEVLYIQYTSLTPFYYTFTGLQNNSYYQFQIASLNARGESPPSAASLPMFTLLTVTGVSVGNPTETTVDIAWDAPGGNAPIYDFFWDITSTPETTTQRVYGNSYTFTGLTPNTEYTFTITPNVGYYYGPGDPVTTDPIRTLLPLPGYGPAMYSDPTNVTATTMDLAWVEYVPEYATSFNVYAYSVIGGLIGFVNVPISSFSYTFTGLDPDTEYYFTVAGVNATGAGTAGPPTVNTYTLIRVDLYFTGAPGDAIYLRPGTYTFEMAGGSSPLRGQQIGGGRSFAYIKFQYILTSPINITYLIGQASPGDIGGAGGTYIYDDTNSQWLFVAGGAGILPTQDPDGHDPGDGSGGAAGTGGGSGAGVNSNGSDSSLSAAGGGGLTYGNGGSGGSSGGFGDNPQTGGFGGGGGGTLLYDYDLPPPFTVSWQGGGGGYTGGTTFTDYYPGISASWYSNPGTSYMIAGSTRIGYNSNVGSAPVTDGYIKINPA